MTYLLISDKVIKIFACENKRNKCNLARFDSLSCVNEAGVPLTCSIIRRG